MLKDSHYSWWRELICVLFGHEWNEHWASVDEDNFVYEEAYRCSRCKLVDHVYRTTGV